MRFSQILKELRQERGVTQKELAQSLQISQSIISFWEQDNAEPTLSVIIKIAKFFDVSVDYLVGIEEYNSGFKEIHTAELDPDEQKIIALYRTMDKELQENAITTMELFARNSRTVKKEIK